MEDMAARRSIWFDEIERGITATEGAGEQGRIFGFFLTWMQEKVRGLFVAATANRINLLPAEMIRKGRFDEVFFVDLPLDDERIEIFKIHLSRRGVDISGLNLPPLTGFTNGWAGAEIEQCVVSAITRAKLEGREVADEDLDRHRRQDGSALAHHERANQLHPRLGLRTRPACLPPTTRPLAASFQIRCCGTDVLWGRMPSCGGLPNPPAQQLPSARRRLTTGAPCYGPAEK